MYVSFKSANCGDNSVTLELHDSSHPYNVEGTFGFHTRKTVPERNRKVTIQTTEIDYAKRRCSESYRTSSDAIAINALNILGYIPVLGLIPCAARLIYPLCNKDSAMHYESPDVKIAEYIRGFFEGIGLGILFLIPDVIITGKRFSGNSEPEESLLASDKV